MSSLPRRRISIDLEKFHQDGLEQLAGLIPHESQENLLKVVISVPVCGRTFDGGLTPG